MHDVAVPDGATANLAPGLNENYEVETFRFHVDTPFVYNRVYEYDLQARKLKLLQDFKMQGPKFDARKYTVTRTHAPTADGELVPITLVHAIAARRNRRNKLLLHGYGHYGLA
jgi:oligopeptidase B